MQINSAFGLIVVLTVLALGLALLVGRRLWRAAAARARTETLTGLLGDLALREAAGELTPEQVGLLRADLQRRIAAETEIHAAEPTPALFRQLSRLEPGRLTLIIAGLLVVVIAASAVMYYLRPASPPPAGAAHDVASVAPVEGHPGGGDVAGMIAQLEDKLRASPDDAGGWGMLGWSYFQTARYDKAATAYERAAKLDPANAHYLSALGESRVRSSGGQVTPAAREAFQKCLTVDPGDPRARYFLAVLKDQNGDPEGAMKDWISLIRTAPPGAPWAAQIRGFVEKLARSRGQDISSRLPPVDVAPQGPAQGASPMQ